MIKFKSFLFAALAAVGLSFTAEAAKIYGPKDYSQKMLLAQWDCSQGVDETGWTDLVSGRKFTWNSGHKITFDENGVYFPCDKASYGTLPAADTTATFEKCTSAMGTIEVVVKAEKPSGSANLGVFQSTRTIFQIYNDGNKFQTLNKIGSGDTCFAVLRANKGTFFNELTTTATLYSNVAGAPQRRGYPLVNGVRSEKSGTSSTWATSGSSVILGNRANNKDSPFKGTIYAIRIYNRQLSYVEIEEHARIDAIRFDGAEDTQYIEKTPMADASKGYTSTFTKESVEYIAESFTNVNEVANWMVPAGVQSIDLLVVGGGASAPQPGGNYTASGSGAGAVVYEENYAVTPGSAYTIQVGAGGAAVRNTTAGTVGNDGSNSTFYLKDSTTDGFTALGGGTGGWGQNATTAYDAHDGGCGGGASYGSSGFAGGKSKQFSTYGYGMGKDGGATGAGKSASGGGATQAGSAQASLSDSVGPVRGGAGFKTDISGVMLEYARGGDAGVTAASSDSSKAGGGADGFDGRGDGGTPAGGYRPAGSGKGGDGVVIIRYAVPRLGAGVQISSEGGMYGTPNPGYGYLESDFPEEYTCPSEVAVDEGVRAVLTGWALYDADNNLIDSGSGNTARFTVSDSTLTLKWQWKKEYQLTATAGENGALANDVSGWYAEGAEINVEAVPNAGYGLFNWTGDVAAADVEKSQITLTMGTTPLSVSAVFAQAIQGSYTVASSVGVSHGEVTPAYGDTSGTFLVGKTLSFSAPQYVVLEEDASRMKCVGYKIYSKESGELIAEDSPAAVGGVVSVDVVFSELFTFEWQWVAEYAVATACDAEQGSVTGAGWYEVEAQVSLQAKPKSANFAFDYWTGDVPEGFETANPLVFVMPDKAVQLTAVFVQTYKLSVNALHGYTVSVLGGTSSFPAYFREGTVMTLQYGPNATAKYTWEGLPEDAVIDESARIVTFTMPAEELTLTLDGEDVINPDVGWYKNIVQDGVGYTVVAFTKTGVEHEFEVPEWVESMEYLVVGGGGSGGRYARCGGGGAGGLVTNVMAVAGGSIYMIKVGAGGAALPAGTSATSGNSGGDSSIELNDTPIVIAYGGGGGGTGSTDGKSGGSGGGAGGYYDTANLARSGGEATQPNSNYGGLGNKGGDVTSSTSKVTRGGGGGGGAGGPGTAGTSSAGAGGEGVMSMITGEEKWYAAGGGGGKDGGGAKGGSGIGGNGSGSNGYPGVDGTGSGGGGSGNTGSYASGKGGDGIVIFRYRNQATLTVTGTPTEVEAATPACGKNEYLSGEVVTCTASEYSQSADHVREYCLGWELLDAVGNVVRSSATTEDPDESARVAKVALVESMTLNWLWETRYELSVVSADTEKGTVTGGDYYAPGVLVEIAATPTEGYRFAEWSNVPEELKYSTPIQLTAGESPLTITATFEDVFEGGVTVEAEGGQLGEPNPAYGDHEYNKGDVVTFSAGEIKIIPDPEEGSRMALVGWKLYDNADLTTPIRTSLDQDEQYDTMTLTFGDTSETLKWVWEKQYSATLTAEHGAITGPKWTSAGSSATYTVAANDGYAFDKWLLNGEEATAEEDGSLVVVDVESAYAVEATFVEIPWGIDVIELVAQDGAAVPKTTHNRVFVDGPYSFPCPAEYVTLTENDTRLKCIGYTVDGGELVEGLTANVTFSRTQDPMPMTIEWQYVTEYYLAVTADDKGTVDVASGWQAENAELTLTATPNDGFAFSNWKVDGAVALENSLEVTMTAATTVEAVFYDPATTERTWTGAKNANWSDAANWSPAVLPTEETDIVIPKVASVNLDNATSFKVRNLTIDGGTVTITQTGINTTFEIGGNLKLMNGGKITCSSFTGTSSIRAINLTVNGEEGISIDETSQITASGTAQIESSPGHSSTSYYGSSYGGRGGYKGGSKVNSNKCYGSIRKPHDYGSRGPWTRAYAGGVIHLIAMKGPIQIAKGGKISADSVQSSSGGGEGSGGSVWLEATAVTGAGLVSAKSVIGISDSVEGGAGRIAVYQAEAATSDNLPKLDASAIGSCGGAGTVYIENANDNGRGWLIVEGCGSAPTPDGVACCIEGKVTGYEEPFKKITIKNCANFVVAEGITLKTDELDIKGNGVGKIFANYKDVVMEGYGSIRIPQGLAIMFY